MKFKNLLLNISFWLHVLYVTQNNQVNLYSTKGPPHKKIKPCAPDYDQVDSSTIGIQTAACTSLYSGDARASAETDEWSSSFEESDLYKYLGLDPKEVEVVSACEKELDVVVDTNSFLNDNSEVPPDAESHGPPDIEVSNEKIPYSCFHDQIYLSLRTENYEERRGSLSTKKGSGGFRDPFSIPIYVESKRPETFYLFSEPVLYIETPTLLTNKTCRYFFQKKPIQSFMQRVHTRDYYYLVFLRFENVQQFFNAKNSASAKRLFQKCKERFSSKLENFHKSVFGNEIILDAPFQILVLRLSINRRLDLVFLNRVDFLFSLMFDQGHNEGTKDSRSVWEEYKRRIGLKEPSEVVELFSVNEIRYSGILCEKSTDEYEKNKLNGKFMTLESKEGKPSHYRCPVTVKKIKVRFLRIPIAKPKKNNPRSRLYNRHLEIEVEFKDIEGL